jgi:hypothetical protein
MASSSKKRTTMAKIARENKLRERRTAKQARKDARRYASANPTLDDPTLDGDGPPLPNDDSVPPDQTIDAVRGPADG